MKKILISLFLVLVLWGCEKHDKQVDNPKYVETIPGGCAADDTTHLKDGNFNPDTVYYVIDNGNLDVFLGFNAECCLHFTTDSQIRNDTIFMDVINVPGVPCNCLCYYTYDFLFDNIDHSYFYVVNVSDFLIFTGWIEP